jgi:hypothetical protein
MSYVKGELERGRLQGYNRGVELVQSTFYGIITTPPYY